MGDSIALRLGLEARLNSRTIVSAMTEVSCQEMHNHIDDIEADAGYSSAAISLDTRALAEILSEPRMEGESDLRMLGQILRATRMDPPSSEQEDGLSDTSTACGSGLQDDLQDPLQEQSQQRSRALPEPPMGTMDLMFGEIPPHLIASNEPASKDTLQSDSGKVLPTLGGLFDKNNFHKTLSDITRKAKEQKIELDKRLKALKTHEDYIEKTLRMSEDERARYDMTLSSTPHGVPEKLEDRGEPQSAPSGKIEHEEALSEEESAGGEKTKRAKRKKFKDKKKAQKQRRQERKRPENQQQQDVATQDTASRNDFVQESDEDNDPTAAQISDADLSKILAKEKQYARELEEGCKEEIETLNVLKAVEKSLDEDSKPPDNAIDEAFANAESAQKAAVKLKAKAEDLQAELDALGKPLVARSKRKTESSQPRPAESANPQAIESRNGQASDRKKPAQKADAEAKAEAHNLQANKNGLEKPQAAKEEGKTESSQPRPVKSADSQTTESRNGQASDQEKPAEGERKEEQEDPDRKLADPKVKPESEETAQNADDPKPETPEEERKARQEEEDRKLAEHLQAQENAKALKEAELKEAKEAKEAEELAAAVEVERERSLKEQAKVVEADLLRKLGEAKGKFEAAKKLKEEQEEEAKVAHNLLTRARLENDELDVKIRKAMQEGQTERAEELRARKRKTLRTIGTSFEAEERASRKTKLHQEEENKAREGLKVVMFEKMS